MIVSIRNIGNSRDVLLPKPVLAQLGVEGDERQMELTVEKRRHRAAQSCGRTQWLGRG